MTSVQIENVSASTERRLPHAPGLKASIALCTYNGAAYLHEQLDSYAKQTVLPAELVVCDDNSSDTTLDILSDFGRTAPFPVRVYVNAQKLGVTKNFERAINLCSGDVIFLSDQDDYWCSNKIARIISLLENDPTIDAVFSNAEIVDQHLENLGYTMWDTVGFSTARQKRAAAPSGCLRELLKFNVVTGATLAFRSKFLPAVLPVPTVWVHDGWIGLIIASLGRLVPLAEALILYRQHGSNQIGGIRRSVIDLVKKANGETSEIAADKLKIWCEQYVLARERLCVVGGCDWFSSAKALFDAKIMHLEKRISMRGAGAIQRSFPATKELVLLRYGRYSAGFASFLKDVFS